jgi:hypothetical protein
MIEPCFTSTNATTHYKESNYKMLSKREVFNENQSLLKKCTYLTTDVKKKVALRAVLSKPA